MTQVAFYYSIGSRYSYLASTQLSTLKEETGCQIEWYPLNSVELIARRGHSPFEGTHASGQYDWSYREQDAQRWADYYGVKFLEPRGRVEFDSQLLALAAVAAKRLGKVEECSHQLFSAMFCDTLTRIDENECVSRAQKCDISEQEFRRELREDKTSMDLESNIQKALKLEVFGVPTFIVDEQMFWGNDRLILLQHYLKRIKKFG